MLLSKFIFFFLLTSLSLCISPSRGLARESDEIEKRIISLNSLGADIVSKLDNDSLVGIPGSSLLKKDDEFAGKVIVSEGRMPPSLEKIIKLKPSLVIGSEGFHDKILDKLADLNIETLKTNTKSINQLEILIKDLAFYLNKNPSSLNNNIKSCYLNKSKDREDLLKGRHRWSGGTEYMYIWSVKDNKWYYVSRYSNPKDWKELK